MYASIAGFFYDSFRPKLISFSIQLSDVRSRMSEQNLCSLQAEVPADTRGGIVPQAVRCAHGYPCLSVGPFVFVYWFLYRGQSINLFPALSETQVPRCVPRKLASRLPGCGPALPAPPQVHTPYELRSQRYASIDAASKRVPPL